MSWGLIVGGGLVLGGAVIGSKGQQDAAETQAQASEKAGQQQLQLGREQLEATRPFRELSLQQGQFLFDLQKDIVPQLQEDLQRPTGTSPLFQRALQQQTRNIFSNLSPFGLEDSSVAGRAVGEATAGLTAQEIENRRAARFTLAGMTPSFQGLSTAGLAGANQLQQGGIQSMFGAGQSRAAGQLGSANSLAGAFGTIGGFGLQGGFDNLSSGTGQPILRVTG